MREILPICSELRERSSYLRMFIEEDITTIERQSMETMADAADTIDALHSALQALLPLADAMSLDSPLSKAERGILELAGSVIRKTGELRPRPDGSP